jgi:hypothetical protein
MEPAKDVPNKIKYLWGWEERGEEYFNIY